MIALLATPWGRSAVIALAAVAMFGVWLTRHDAKVAKKAEVKIVQASQQAGRAANIKNENVRKRASIPGSVERLKKQYCRDC